MGAEPGRTRKVVTLQTTRNLGGTPLRPPVYVKQGSPWWGQELYETKGCEMFLVYRGLS